MKPLVDREAPRYNQSRELLRRLEGANGLWKHEVAKRIGLDLVHEFVLRIEQAAFSWGEMREAAEHLQDDTIIDKARLVSQWHGAMDSGPLEVLDAELGELRELVHRGP